MSYRIGFWGTAGSGNGDNRGISKESAIITAIVVVGLVVLALTCLYLYRRKKQKRSMRNHTRPTLPTHMSQLPPLPPAYIRPTSTRDLPTYRSAQATSSTGPHAAWAAPAPPYKPRDPPSAAPIDTPIVTSSPPTPRRSIFRRPVPPLHTAHDLAPPPEHIPGAQAQVLPQVTPYDHRRGENPFGTRGVDERHPGAAESEAGDVPAGNRVVDKSQESPPVYAEAVGR